MQVKGEACCFVFVWFCPDESVQFIFLSHMCQKKKEKENNVRILFLKSSFVVCGGHKRVLVTCCTALTGCPFKSCWSQKIQSSQRFVYGSGADVTIERFQVGNSAGSELVVAPCEKLRSVDDHW